MDRSGHSCKLVISGIETDYFDNQTIQQTVWLVTLSYLLTSCTDDAEEAEVAESGDSQQPTETVTLLEASAEGVLEDTTMRTTSPPTSETAQTKSASNGEARPASGVDSKLTMRSESALKTVAG